jgi:hypothetical protein
LSWSEHIKEYALWNIAMTWNYRLWVFVTLLYCILLVHVGVEAFGKKHVKSPQQSSWNKVAGGVKVTSNLIIDEILAANTNLCEINLKENKFLRLKQHRMRLAVIKCCGKNKCYSNSKGNRRRNNSKNKVND